ncbi:hypothetical protein FQN50_004969 [Emmonsiellopsis sp. PD_5]|nr:hypothetical protein FQN50_004969 [Emmonsiellopsis sp. PD_5]
MGEKVPNHIFSTKHDRTISKSRSVLSSGFRRLSFPHRGGSYSPPSSIQGRKMPSKRAASMARNGSAEDPVQKDDVDEVINDFDFILKYCHFMKHPEFQRRINALKGVVEPELDRADEIEQLKQSLRTISAIKDEEMRDIQDKVTRIESENNKLKEEAKLVAQEKKKLAREKLEQEEGRRSAETSLADQKTKLENENKETMRKKEKELQDEYVKKTQAEKNKIQGKLQRLEKERDSLEESKKELRAELQTNKKRNRVLIEGLEDEGRKLEARLRKVDPTFKVSQTQANEYEKRVADMCDGMRDFTRYFERLPAGKEDLITDPLGSKKTLIEASRIFEYASFADSSIAISLRMAAVREFISRQTISILQSKLFLPCTPSTNEGRPGEAILETISSKLAPDDELVWRRITIEAIDNIPQYSVSPDIVISQISQEILGKLHPLVSDDLASGIERDAKTIIRMALDIWSLLRNESRKITINYNPGPVNDGSWDAWELKEDMSQPSSPIENSHSRQNSHGSTAMPSATARFPSPESFVIFPQIVGEFELNVNGTGEDEDGPGPSHGNRKRVVLHRGIALFSDSDLFHRGWWDIQHLRDVHRRHMSISSPTNSFLNFSHPPLNPVGAEGPST